MYVYGQLSAIKDLFIIIKESCKNISPKTILITYHLYPQRLENPEVKRPIFYAALQAAPQEY